jgi:predicted NBD/HSP70 family sugar kinase
MTVTTDVHRLVVQLEHTRITISAVRCLPNIERVSVHRVEPDLTDPTGARVFRQIDTEARRLTSAAFGLDNDNVPIHVILPGSLENERTIVRISRLNVHQRCDLLSVLGPRADYFHLVNDVYASAIGQLTHLLPDQVRHAWDTKVVLFVYVDEGVGSLILYKGKVLRGAGFAGPLGHAIVEPTGQYFDDFRARGVLEAYCSRPWLSSNLVNRYYTDRDKRPNSRERRAELEQTAFRRALGTINLEEKDTLSYELLSDGIGADDPIAVFGLEEASDYLGQVIAHLIVAINPHLIVLDGAMVHKLTGFFARTLESTRRYTWVDAWNATRIVPVCSGC